MTICYSGIIAAAAAAGSGAAELVTVTELVVATFVQDLQSTQQDYSSY